MAEETRNSAEFAHPENFGGEYWGLNFIRDHWPALQRHEQI
jgi:hypothetical protein